MSMNQKKQQNSLDLQLLEAVSTQARTLLSCLDPGIATLAEGTAQSGSALICLRDCDITVTVSVRRLLPWEREQRISALASLCAEDTNGTPSAPRTE